RARRAPGAEMLGRETLAGVLADIVVDVLRIDRTAVAVLVDILEQLLARQFLDGAHDARDAAVRELQLPFLPRLADEGEAEASAFHPDVTGLQRGQAEASVLALVGLVADADHRAVEEQ